ncbi:hypothetical protein RN629_05315 [Sphingomonadaceae bacterium jetA1]|uniref:hypothetical protein n=1 Tax=Facivitalis istanbulensis TaxID=3075838 RepID=UPI0034848B62
MARSTTSGFKSVLPFTAKPRISNVAEGAEGAPASLEEVSACPVVGENLGESCAKAGIAVSAVVTSMAVSRSIGGKRCAPHHRSISNIKPPDRIRLRLLAVRHRSIS